MAHSSPSVLIIRLDAIGDAIALAPLLQALAREDIPTDIVLRSENAGVFTPAAARQMLVAPFDLRSSARPNLAAIAHFGAELAERGYTHVLVATEDPGGYRLAAATRAPFRSGFSNGWGKPFKTLWVRSLLTTTLHRSAGLDVRAPHECEVLFALGQSLVPGTSPTRDAALLRPLLIDAPIEADPRVALQITDKWERLGIPFDDIVQLVCSLAGSTPLRVIASARESAYAMRVRERTGIATEFFDTLAPWKAAIACARALVAPDSGAIHVAGMAGTPTVAIFPHGADFALQVARWHPWAAPYRAIEARSGWNDAADDALVELLARCPEAPR
ncbi:MAG: glycosyltransferase family 9 protein [Vulcanimicrobiaceae bacterium]